MKIKVTSNLSHLKSTVPYAVAKADHILATQVENDTEKFVPALTGSLSYRTLVIGGAIIYPGPYAHYLYVGKLFVDPETDSPFASKGAKKEKTDRNLVFTKSTHRQAQSHWFEASEALNKEKWRRVYKKAVVKELGE